MESRGEKDCGENILEITIVILASKVWFKVGMEKRRTNLRHFTVTEDNEDVKVQTDVNTGRDGTVQKECQPLWKDKQLLFGTY